MIAGAPTLDSVFRSFQRVQLDHFFPQSSTWRNLHPLDNLPDYGGDIGRRNSNILRLFLNDPLPDKMPPLIAYVQYGIDLLHMNALGQTWIIGGSGHKPGQMLPLAFAAVMLDHPQLKTYMQSVNTSDIEENISTYKNAAGHILFGQEEGTGPTAERRYWDSVATAQGFKTRKDPYQYVDGGYNPGTSYQSIIAPIFRAEVLAADLIPEIKTVWNNPEFFEYVHRSSELGAWSQPDPCAPYDGNMANYGITFGPDGQGSCIKDTNPADGTGRFPLRHGASFMAVAYRTAFQDAMWNTYSTKITAGPPPINNPPEIPTPPMPTDPFLPFKNVFNPMNESLTINLIADMNSGTVTIFDKSSREIRSLNISNGQAQWDGRNISGQIVASGTYVALVKSGDKIQKKKVVVVK